VPREHASQLPANAEALLGKPYALGGIAKRKLGDFGLMNSTPSREKNKSISQREKKVVGERAKKES